MAQHKPDEPRSIPRTHVKNPEAEARGWNPSTLMAGQAVETGETAETHGPASLAKPKQDTTKTKTIWSETVL